MDPSSSPVLIPFSCSRTTSASLNAAVRHLATSYPYDNIEDLLELADELSNTEGRIVEGFVCKSLERNFSFKVISNSYLLGEK